MGELVLQLDRIAFGGEALGRHDGQVIFVPGALPGERARVRLIEHRRDYARGEVMEVLEESPRRTRPACPYFGSCGGCQWQHADYAAQLQFKRQIVAEQLQRIGGFPDAEDLVRPTIGMVWPWQYRNQVRFSVGRRFGELCFVHRQSHRLVRIDYCYIAHPEVAAVAARIQGRLSGVRLHQVTIRYGCNTGQLLVSPHLPQVPDLPTGQDHLEEELLGRRFSIAPSSFFQVNTRRERRGPPVPVPPGLVVSDDGLSMAEVLALIVLDRLQVSGSETVIDAYCGVGTFAILVAPLVRQVIGIEESRAAVLDARHNARDLGNVTFVEGKCEVVLPSLSDRPDAVILDPARAGCQPAVIKALAEARPARIVYASCDPSTLARDLALLVHSGFRLEEVQPLDMFPQTYHVESVASLSPR